MVKEILINNSAVSNLIRENDIHQIPTAMQMGKRE
jgi:Tfp pilus assembly pilus retraction ATPase PilT